MLKRTLWRPDTHDCVVEIEWDDEVAEDQRTFTVKAIHGSTPGITGTVKQKFEQILAENRLKNSLQNHLHEPELKVSFDGERKMHVKSVDPRKLADFPQKDKVVIDE